MMAILRRRPNFAPDLTEAETLAYLFWTDVTRGAKPSPRRISAAPSGKEISDLPSSLE